MFQGVPGCSGGVPGVFRGVSRVFRECSGVFWEWSGVFRCVPECSGCVPGFTDTRDKAMRLVHPPREALTLDSRSSLKIGCMSTCLRQENLFILSKFSDYTSTGLRRENLGAIC